MVAVLIQLLPAVVYFLMGAIDPELPRCRFQQDFPGKACRLLAERATEQLHARMDTHTGVKLHTARCSLHNNGESLNASPTSKKRKDSGLLFYFEPK